MTNESHKCMLLSFTVALHPLLDCVNIGKNS